MFESKLLQNYELYDGNCSVFIQVLNSSVYFINILKGHKTYFSFAIANHINAYYMTKGVRLHVLSFQTGVLKV